jgi:hypothetical protein
MNIDLKLLLEFENFPTGMYIAIHDRNSEMARIDSLHEYKNEILLKISLPNQVKIMLVTTGEKSCSIKLDSLVLGGLRLPKNILDQICRFTPSNSDSEFIVTNWWSEGVVYIDFFAADWVQYHLLYGNKIDFQNYDSN